MWLIFLGGLKDQLVCVVLVFILFFFLFLLGLSQRVDACLMLFLFLLVVFTACRCLLFSVCFLLRCGFHMVLMPAAMLPAPFLFQVLRPVKRYTDNVTYACVFGCVLIF